MPPSFFCVTQRISHILKQYRLTIITGVTGNDTGRSGCILDDIEEQIMKQAEFASGLRYEDIPDDVKARARWVILDSIGCVMRGRNAYDYKYSKDNMIIKTAVSMINTELYEGNRKAVGHPAAHILPLMFVRGRELKLKDFIRIFVASYEVASRWGRSITFSHDILGHGTVMTAGALVAECLIEGLSANDIYESLLVCGSCPEVSVWQSVFDGSGLHDAYAGISAMKAVQSVEMMKSGIRSTGKIINSVYSDIMGASIAPEKLSEGLGQEYLLCSNYFKLHTGCRFVHQFADVISSELKNGLDPASVDRIDVYTYKKAAKIKDQSVPNDLAAKFSIPVSIAVLLEKRELSPDTIKCFDAPDVKKWEGRITLYEDKDYNLLLPDIRCGRVEITFNDGSMKVIEVRHAKGDFDNPVPYTEAELIEKFETNTAGKLPIAETILHGSEETVFDDAGMNFMNKIEEE